MKIRKPEGRFFEAAYPGGAFRFVVYHNSVFNDFEISPVDEQMRLKCPENAEKQKQYSRICEI